MKKVKRMGRARASAGGKPKGKKGQLTMFIILGIVLIFSTAIILFIKSQAEEEMPKTPRITEKLPAEIQPVRDYVEECLRFTGKEAVEMIGVHGGYVGLSPDDTVYTSRTFDNDMTGRDPTSHESLSVSQEWNVPYWHHMESDNDCRAQCRFDSERPPLYRTGGSGSIEEQIDTYVKRNIEGCLGGFEDMEEQGFIVEPEGNLSVRTVITDESVIIFVEYPHEVYLEDSKHDISQFMVTLDVDLKEVYGLATKITTKSVENKFLEQHVLNLISAFSGIDEDALPPMTGTEFSFLSKRWLKSEVTQQLQDILSIYINLLQVTQTKNFRLNYFPNDKLATGLYSHMVLPVEESNYDKTVDFNYLGWPIYFYISPGEMIKAREGVAVPIASLFIPFQRYDLPYDVSFPVMVEIRDTDAYKGEGYSFFIGLEGNIRNNEPVTEDSISFRQMSDPTAQAQFCNEDQRTSGDVTITTTDTRNEPIEGATVFFSVGDLMCPIGETELTEDGEKAVFTGKFPSGAIGTLIVRHPEAAPYTQEFFRAGQNPMTVDTIRLKKYKTLNATAVKFGVEKQEGAEGGSEWVFKPSPESLGQNDEVMITLRKIKESSEEPEVMAAASVTPDSNGSLRLVPGKYDMRVLLIRDHVTLTLPSQEIEGEETPELSIVDDGEFPTTYEAKIRIDNSIYNAEEMQFKALNFKWPEVPEEERTLEDMEAWSNTTQYATQNLNYLTPSLIQG
ncbi:MAG: hypothetical protein R6U32_07520 [Candidatus Woesearchaeota archaeon]